MQLVYPRHVLMNTNTLLEETNHDGLSDQLVTQRPSTSELHFFTPVANSQFFCVASTSSLVLQMVSAKSHFYFCSTRGQPYH
jgi:hypothetical protein